MKYAVSLCVITAMMLLGAGCHKEVSLVPPGRGLIPTPLVYDQPPPHYQTLVKRYNARTADLSQLWSRAKVHIQWRDDDGHIRKENGHGNLIFRRPNDLALTVGKLGNVGLWIGSNQENYWLLDLQGDGIAYVGRHRFVGLPCAKPLPLAIYPSDLLLVMGLSPIDPSQTPDEPAVEMIAGYAMIEPPHRSARFLLNPQTGQPVRIDLLDPDGRSIVICRLAQPQHPSPTTSLPTHIDLYLLNGDAKLTVELTSLRTDSQRIKPAAFNLGFLLNAHKPRQQILLDRNCEPSAQTPPRP